MAKKILSKKRKIADSYNPSKKINREIKEVEKEIEHFENWTYQRRKFIIKFLLVFGILFLILLVLNFI